MASPTLKDYRDTYYAASLKAGDIARQLAFAGIALIWIFQRTAKDASDAYSLPKELYWPALFIVATLTLDLFQYCFKSAIWSFIQWKIEKQFGPDLTKSYTVQEFLNWPTLAMFWGKLFTIAIAYLLLFSFVISHVKFSPITTSTNVISNGIEQLPSVNNKEKINSSSSLSNNVKIIFSEDKPTASAEPRGKTESVTPIGSTTLQNNVTIELPVISKTIVRPIVNEKKKDPCKPCDVQQHENLKELGVRSDFPR